MRTKLIAQKKESALEQETQLEKRTFAVARTFAPQEENSRHSDSEVSPLISPIKWH